MIRKRNNEICFNLVGGLGNQLFIYFAGQYVEYFSDKKVCYRHFTLSKKDSIHKSSILDFNMDLDLRQNSDLRKKWDNLLRFSDKCIHAFFSKFFRVDVNFLSSNYFSSSHGFDQKLLSNLDKKQIYGYFQSAFYFEKTLPMTKFQLILKNPSAQYLKDSHAAAANPPIMLHVRRGDYMKNPQIGILAKRYYELAINKVEEQIGEREIWVFSDEIDLARKLINFLPNSRLRFVKTDDYRSDSESLALMTKGVGLITSNSTFSYWAGVFSANAEIIVAPNKWFRSQLDPEGLIPESWTRVMSVWENDEYYPEKSYKKIN